MSVGVAEVSDHAMTRWAQRVGDSRGARAAWRESIPVPIEDTGLDGDEARYHPDSDTALVRKDDTLTTVIEVESGRPELRYTCRHLRGGRR
jgi:hypothetical protein